MADWSKYPFLRMLIPMMLGIWCASFFSSFRLSSDTLLLVMLALFGLAVTVSLSLKTMRLNWLFGAIMGCYLFLGGYALTCTHEAWAQMDYYRNYETDAKCYVARVYDYPTERGNNIRVPLQLEYQFGDSLPSRAVSGKVMAYFQKTDSAFALRYGDLISIDAPVGEVSRPKNPEEFDYRASLYRKGITGQTFLKGENWIDLQTNNGNPIYAFSYRFRDILLASLQQCGLHGDEFDVAAAVLLGYDDSLADEIRKNYAAAGSMHILCVSGMHVGIIYLVASALLGFLKRKKWQKVLKDSLLLALIWFYALIAGLTPSIMRAAMMLSFVIIGEMIQRKGFAINSIAASAFVLLCVNPNNLFEIGFQLSYAAVVGIVVLQRPVYNLFYFKNKLLDKAWEITAVSLAAQIATIPFTLFYFNQFTTYFWLSNLLLTPLSFLVVMGGMLLLLVSWIPYVNVGLGYVVWGSVFVMNWIAMSIDGLPSSIFKGLYISEFEFAMLMTAFVLLLVAVAARRRKMLLGMLSALLLFMVSLTARTYSTGNYSGMTFYSLRKHTAVDFVSGGGHILLADSALMADESAVDYSLKGNWAKRNLSLHPQVVGLDEDFEGPVLRKRRNLVSFNGKLLALWNDELAAADSLSYRLPVDYLLITKSSTGKGKSVDLQSVTNAFQVNTLLIDGTVPGYLAERWATQAKAAGLTCHCLGDGAFEAEN